MDDVEDSDMARVSDAEVNVAAAQPVEALPSKLAKSLGRRLAPLGSICALMLAWEVTARSGVFTPYLLPSLETIFARVAHDVVTGHFFIQAAYTLYRALAGFALAAVVAVSIGTLMSRKTLVRWFFDPIISVGFPMPKVAFLPIFLLWFGAYDASKILLVAFAAFFAIAVNTVAGTQGVERYFVWSAQSLGSSERRILWSVILPAALPQILTGLQIGLPLALIVCIVAEMLMGGVGLGGSMIYAQRFADSPGVFAGIVEIGFVGWFAIFSLRKLRQRLLAWHVETTRK
jgi:ABC-type nitrate/sulfonate/bicarbonate transport system permease component